MPPRARRVVSRRRTELNSPSIQVWTRGRHRGTVSACRASGGRTSWPAPAPGAAACTRVPRGGSVSGERCRPRTPDHTRSARPVRSTTGSPPMARPTRASPRPIFEVPLKGGCGPSLPSAYTPHIQLRALAADNVADERYGCHRPEGHQELPAGEAGRDRVHRLHVPFARGVGHLALRAAARVAACLLGIARVRFSERCQLRA
jgi:hypothetical protein